MLAAVAWLFCGSGADAGEAGAFYCAGSEPLWEVSVQAGKGQFGTVLEGTRALVGRAEVTPGGEPGWRGRASDGVELLLSFETAACTNPLLREPVRHRALLVVGGTARLSGCCRLAADGVAVADDGRRPASGAAPAEILARVRAEPGNMVNVREEPALVHGNVVTKLPAGAHVDIADAEIHAGELWYRVRLAGAAGVGWIRGDLVEPAVAQPDGAQASWQMRLELIPAIDRCLEKMTAHPALVTKAYGGASGVIGVRLMDAEGRRWACTEGEAGFGAPDVIPVQTTDRLPGEFTPLFLRAPDVPTRDPCYRHEPLRDSAGQILGWLSFGLCS